MQACGHTPSWSGQRIERTNSRGRHFYLPEFKRWIVDQALTPGTSVAALAMANQINANQLRRWMQLHSRQSTLPVAVATLLPVTITAQPDAAPTGDVPRVPAIVEVELAGAVVRVPEGASAATLQMVLRCLRSSAS
jgi:transposase